MFVPPPPTVTPVSTKKAPKEVVAKPIEVRKPFMPLREAKCHPLEEQIEWVNIRNLCCSENPTAGVFFVETQKEGQVVVVKATSTLAQEIFGGMIASFLGLVTPQIRLMEYRADFKNPIKNYWVDCKKNLKDFATRNQMYSEERKIAKELYRAFFLLIELVEGAVSLEDLMNDEQLANEILKNPKVLHDIGKMIVMDIVLNNCDRFPLGLIWDHEGNPSNILFSIRKNRLACIDQPFMAIFDSKQRSQYLQKVQAFSNVCVKENRLDNNPYIEQISTYIHNVTGVVLDTESKAIVLGGIVEGSNQLKDLSKEKLEVLKTSIEKMKTGSDYEGTYFTSLVTIDIDFIHDAIQHMTVN